MPKPLTIKLAGTFEMKDSVSLKELTATIAEAQALLSARVGPGTITVKIGRQEFRA